MDKKEYLELLQTDEWDKVRKRILSRDQYRCQCCGAENLRLNVHHKIYISGKKPWEVPDDVLVSLCDSCHSKAHENRTIGSFFRGNKTGKYGQNKRINRNTNEYGHKRKRQIWVAGKGLVDI